MGKELDADYSGYLDADIMGPNAANGRLLMTDGANAAWVSAFPFQATAPTPTNVILWLQDLRT